MSLADIPIERQAIEVEGLAIAMIVAAEDLRSGQPQRVAKGKSRLATVAEDIVVLGRDPIETRILGKRYGVDVTPARFRACLSDIKEGRYENAIESLWYISRALSGYQDDRCSGDLPA